MQLRPTSVQAQQLLHVPPRGGRCEDDAVLRSVTLGIAWSLMASACALVEPPVPPGTYPVEAEVRNSSARPVEFTVVRAAGGALPGGNQITGAVQPASVPAGASGTKVIFHLPTDGQWLINIPGWGEIEGKDFDSFLALQCRPLQIYFDADGGWGWPGCTRSP